MLVKGRVLHSLAFHKLVNYSSFCWGPLEDPARPLRSPGPALRGSAVVVVSQPHQSLSRTLCCCPLQAAGCHHIPPGRPSSTCSLSSLHTGQYNASWVIWPHVDSLNPSERSQHALTEWDYFDEFILCFFRKSLLVHMLTVEQVSGPSAHTWAGWATSLLLENTEMDWIVLKHNWHSVLCGLVPRAWRVHTLEENPQQLQQQQRRLEQHHKKTHTIPGPVLFPCLITFIHLICCSIWGCFLPVTVQTVPADAAGSSFQLK